LSAGGGAFRALPGWPPEVHPSHPRSWCHMGASLRRQDRSRGHWRHHGRCSGPCCRRQTQRRWRPQGCCRTDGSGSKSAEGGMPSWVIGAARRSRLAGGTINTAQTTW